MWYREAQACLVIFEEMPGSWIHFAGENNETLCGTPIEELTEMPTEDFHVCGACIRGWKALHREGRTAQPAPGT